MKRFRLILTLDFSLLSNGDSQWSADLETKSCLHGNDVREVEKRMIEAGMAALEEFLIDQTGSRSVVGG